MFILNGIQGTFKRTPFFPLVTSFLHSLLLVLSPWPLNISFPLSWSHSFFLWLCLAFSLDFPLCQLIHVHPLSHFKLSSLSLYPQPSPVSSSLLDTSIWMSQNQHIPNWNEYYPLQTSVLSFTRSHFNFY